MVKGHEQCDIERHRMEDILETLKLPESHRKLVCEFLLVFSRFEFALKHNRCFIEYRGGGLGIDRKRFELDIQVALATRLQWREDLASIQPLLDRPAMQQENHRNSSWFQADAVVFALAV